MPDWPLYSSGPLGTNWNTSESPSQSRPIQAAAGPRRMACRASSQAISSASRAQDRASTPASLTRPHDPVRRKFSSAGARGRTLANDLALPGDVLQIEASDAGSGVRNTRHPVVFTRIPVASRISFPSPEDA